MFRKILFFTMLFTLAYPQGKVPNVRLKMLDGSSAKLYDYLKDGPMIIDFWATWCPPCQAPMAHNVKMIKKNPQWKGRVRIIAVSIDLEPEHLTTHLK